MHAKEDGYEGMATPNYNVQTATQNQYVTNYDTYDSAGESPLLWALSTPVWEKTESSHQLLSKMPDTDVRKYMSARGGGVEAVVKYPNYDAESTRCPIKPGQYDKFGFRLSPDESTLIGSEGHLMRMIRTKKHTHEAVFAATAL